MKTFKIINAAGFFALFNNINTQGGGTPLTDILLQGDISQFIMTLGQRMENLVRPGIARERLIQTLVTIGAIKLVQNAADLDQSFSFGKFRIGL